MNSEKCCLKWNDFQINMTSSIQTLKNNQELTDVTLVCEDNQRIEAHKVIVSSASNFFRSILTENDHSHPLIYMRGVQVRYLQYVLDFIYKGETNVLQGDLNNFLQLSKELELTGLKDYHEIADKHYIKPKNGMIEAIKENQLNLSNINLLEEPPNEEVNKTSNHSLVSIKKESHILMDKTKMSIPVRDENIEFDERIINTMLEKVNQVWTCTKCGKTDKRNKIWNVKRHIETHIVGISQNCDFCGKIFNSRNSLQVHITRTHIAK